MDKQTRNYDSTLARIAGNIASGLVRLYPYYLTDNANEPIRVAKVSVDLAELIILLRCKAVAAEQRSTEET